ncbi:Detected protein of unknown function [Hibiscus syriacus]|uniref:Uncharacterized protein n=1 Tax=Hibiscus syriacus TaxID=106335 RepID=A0A6A3C6Q1_HIBSY|nr:Detected protein of unknown function [Hibiscus syriacus]
MSLNCLNCQILKRTDSDNDIDHHCAKPKYARKIRSKKARSKSEISPAVYEQLRREEPIMQVVGSKKGHHRRLNTVDNGAVAFEVDCNPRLLRSSGMRRDWSFEMKR